MIRIVVRVVATIEPWVIRAIPVAIPPIRTIPTIPIPRVIVPTPWVVVAISISPWAIPRAVIPSVVPRIVPSRIQAKVKGTSYAIASPEISTVIYGYLSGALPRVKFIFGDLALWDKQGVGLTVLKVDFRALGTLTECIYL